MENKTSKPALPAGRYFKYAIGEIILVVIGILIALQINNQNENRKETIEESPILQNLHDEFSENKKMYDLNISRNRKYKTNRIYHNEPYGTNRGTLKKQNIDSLIYSS